MKSSSFNCITYVRVYMYYPDRMEEAGREEEEKEVESRWLQQNDVVMCQTCKTRMYVISSNIDAFLFFSFFFSFFLLASFFPLCALLHIQLYEERERRKKRRNNVSDGRVAQVSIITSSSLLCFHNLPIK